MRVTADAAAHREALGRKIHNLRKSLRLRLKDVALMTSISVPKLCRIEHGQERIRLEDLAVIAGALGTTMHEILPKRVRRNPERA